MAVLGSEPKDLAAVQAIQTSNSMMVNAGIESNDPDKATRAVHLAQATDIPAEQVFEDPEYYENQTKKMLSDTLVRSSPPIQQYINSDPMATHVSSDDWAPIWDFGRFLDRLWNGPMSAEHRERVAAAPLAKRPDIENQAKALIEGGKEGIYGMMKALPTLAGLSELPEERQKALSEAEAKMKEMGYNPLLRQFLSLEAWKQERTAEGLWGLSPLLLSYFARVPYAPVAAVAGSAIGNLVSQEVSKPIEERTGIPSQYTDTALMIVGTALGFKHLYDLRSRGTRIQQIQNAIRMSDPFAQLQKTPPVGFNDVTDFLHKAAAEREAEMVKETIDAAKKVQTRERVPELGVKFARGIVGDGMVEIDGDAVRKLYADKLPEPDDGLLGWIPDLEEQFIRNAKGGGPIRVRADEYFGKIDPAVHKEIADHFRIDSDGMTPDQAKNTKVSEVQPRAEIRPEEGAWNVYVDDARVKSFISRSSAEDYLMSVAPEQSLEGGLRKAAGIDQVDYDWTPTNEVGIESDLKLNRLLFQLPKIAYDRIVKLRTKVEDARKDRQLAKAERKVRAERGPEWQDRFDQKLKEVSEDLKDNPQYQIKQLFDDAIIGDTNLPENVRIDRASLSKDEQKLVPRNWMAKKGGLRADDIATKLLGMDKRTMLNHIEKLVRDAGKTGRTDYFLRVMSEEARQRMQREFGDPAQKILDEAMDHVTDDNSFGMVWEHLLAVAMKANKTIAMDPEGLRDSIVQEVRSQPFSRRLLEDAQRDMGKAHKASVEAAAKKDWNELLIQQQRYVYNHVVEQEAKKLNTRIRDSDRFDKQFGKREVPGYAVEHTDRIHDIMVRTGSDVKRGPGPAPSGTIDLAKAIARHDAAREGKGYSPGLQGFFEEHIDKTLPVEDHMYENDNLPNMVVYKELFDKDWVKHPNDMTVGEWTAIADTKQSIAKWGKEAYYEISAGKRVKLDDLVDQIVHDIEFFPDKQPTYDKLGVAKDAKPRTIRTMWAGLRHMEPIIMRIGRYDPNAPFIRAFHKLVDAVNNARALETEYGKRLNELAELSNKFDMKGTLPNDVFYEPKGLIKDDEGKWVVPSHGHPFRPMTEHNLVTLMLNFGLESGQKRVTERYGTTPEVARHYINQHATKAHWDFVEGVWKLMRDIKDAEDARDIRLQGVPIAEEVGARIETPFGIKRGMYYPLINDRMDPFFNVQTDNYRFRNTRVRGADSWEKPRTTHDGPVSLDLADLNGHLARRLRALGVREALAEFTNIIEHPKFQRAFSSRYSKETTNLWGNFLKDIAGVPGWESPTLQGFGRYFDAFRRGSTQAAAGFSTKILGKHAPTALIHAIGEVGVTRLMEAFHHMYVNNSKTIAQNRDFIYGKTIIAGHEDFGSREVQGRKHHWNETIGGGVESMMGNPPSLAEARRYGLPTNMSLWRVMKQEMIQAGSWAIQSTDMAIAEAVHLAKYTHAMEELAPTRMDPWEMHLEARRLADMSVRNALGSTAVTSRSALFRSSMWYYRALTAFMGFFNNTQGRLMTSIFKTKDAFREYSQTGDGKMLMSELSGSKRILFHFFIMTAFIEQAAESLYHKDMDPAWYKYGVKPFIHLGAQMFPTARTIYAAFEYGKGFNPGATIVDSGIEKLQKLTQVLTDPRQWQTPRGRVQIVGSIMDALAATKSIGNYQTSHVGQAILNVLFGGDVPRDVKDFFNEWNRGTTREPRPRRRRSFLQ